MGFFSNLISKLTGGSPPGHVTSATIALTPSAGQALAPQAEHGQPEVGASITVSVMGPRGPVDVRIQQTEIAERVGRYGFVMRKDLPPLKATEQWWNEESHKRRMRDGPDKAYAWLIPFVPLEVLKLPELQEIQANMVSPNVTHAMVKALRSLVRAKRKAKEPHSELLKALYGAAVAADFVDSLEFEGRQPHYMAQFVDVRDMGSVEINFSKLGYQCISALGKTDVRWLVGGFGEPAEHQSLVAAWPPSARMRLAATVGRKFVVRCETCRTPVKRCRIG